MGDLLKNHRDLEVWKESINLIEDVYTLTRCFPDDERFGLTMQLRRAVTSVPANIAEGAARGTKKEFIRFLYIARGSLIELDTHLIVAKRLGFCDENHYNAVEQKREHVSRLLYGLIRALKTK